MIVNKRKETIKNVLFLFFIIILVLIIVITLIAIEFYRRDPTEPGILINYLVDWEGEQLELPTTYLIYNQAFVMKFTHLQPESSYYLMAFLFDLPINDMEVQTALYFQISNVTEQTVWVQAQDMQLFLRRDINKSVLSIAINPAELDLSALT